MQDYDWKKDLDEGIWPQPWPDRGSRLSKMNAVFEDNETSKKQLEYMHIYLYHNREGQAGGPSRKAFSPHTAKYWADYFGYNTTGPTDSNSVLRKISGTKQWAEFKIKRKAYLDEQRAKKAGSLPAHNAATAPLSHAAADSKVETDVDLSSAQKKIQGHDGAAADGSRQNPLTLSDEDEDLNSAQKGKHGQDGAAAEQAKDGVAAKIDVATGKLPKLFSQKICDMLKNYLPSQAPKDWSEYMEWLEKWDSSKKRVYVSAERRKEMGIITLSDFPALFKDLLAAMGDHQYCIVNTEPVLLRCLAELEHDLELCSGLKQLKDDSGEWSTNKVAKLFDTVLGGKFGQSLAWEEIFEKLFHEDVSSQRYQISLQKLKESLSKISFKTTEEKVCIHVFWKYVTELNKQFFSLYPEEYGVEGCLRCLLASLLKAERKRIAKALLSCKEQSSHGDLNSVLPGHLGLFVISEHPGALAIWHDSPQTIDFVRTFTDANRSRFETEFHERTDLHSLIGKPDDSMEVKQDIAWDCIVSNAIEEEGPRLPTWRNLVPQIRSWEGCIMGKDVYHSGAEFPNPLAVAEEATALQSSGASGAGKKAVAEEATALPSSGASGAGKKHRKAPCVAGASGAGEEGPLVNLRVHFYNCPEIIGSGNNDSSLPQSQRSMVESSTQDYRIDREMAPVFYRLPSKLPSSVPAFDRVVEVAADADRKEKALKRAQQAESRTRNLKRHRSDSNGGGDGGAGSG